MYMYIYIYKLRNLFKLLLGESSYQPRNQLFCNKIDMYVYTHKCISACKHSCTDFCSIVQVLYYLKKKYTNISNIKKKSIDRFVYKEITLSHYSPFLSVC